jgi:putative two-component system response regulator
MRDLSQCTILIVDDMETNIEILRETLGDLYNVSVAMDGQSALKNIPIVQPDLILLDIMMPQIDGYEVCRQLKSDEETQKIPIIFITAMSNIADEHKGLELGAIDYITKPISMPIVRARVRNHLELKLAKEELENQNVLLEQRVQERTQELSVTQDVTIQSLASLAETRDNETGGHIQRTQHYIKALAEYLDQSGRFGDFFTPDTMRLLFKSSPLHDIGKVGVADAILLKPGRLTPEEFEKMKRHTEYGHDALLEAEKGLGSNSFLRFAREIAYTHHEKWDGSGYPRGLSQKEIPLSGRLMAIADVYDALISRRVYKPPFSHAKACDIIADGRDSHFDPDLVDAFLARKDTFMHIASDLADSEEERDVLVS